MAQTSHTPRFWEVEGGPGYGELNGVKVVNGRNGLVVAVAIGDVPELDAKAHARLIAAAPGLLEAVQSLRTAILMNGEWDDGCFYHNQRTASELQRPLELARAAIAKAEGSTNA